MSDGTSTGLDRAERYMAALEDGRYAEAADQFTEDVVYHHPIRADPIVGREELREFFATERASRDGAADIVHEIQNTVVEGNRCAIQGRVTGGGRDSLFVAYVEVRDGKISYYVPAPNRSTVW